MEFKNRAERRAYQFKGIKPAAVIQEEMLPRVIVKQSSDDSIYVPIMTSQYSVMDYMLPYDGIGKVSKEAENLLNKWFFSGLSSLTLVLKPEVYTKSGHNVEKVLKSYISEILGSFSPCHEHKMKYLAYVLDTTCSSFSFEV